MINRKKQRFKVGDIISPLPNRKKSNDMFIAGVKRFKVMEVQNHYAPTTCAQRLQLKIIEGYMKNWTGILGPGKLVNVYSNAFMLSTNNSNYEIF